MREGQLGLRQSDALFHHTAALPEMLAELGQKVNLTQIELSAYPPGPARWMAPICHAFWRASVRPQRSAQPKAFRWFQTTHQQGHIAAALYAAGDFTLFERESLVFHVSGGTTDLLLCHGAERITPLAQAAICTPDRLWTASASSWAFRSRRASISASRPLCVKKSPSKVSVHGLTCSLSGLENQCAKLLADGHDAPYVCKYCLLCVGETLVRMANNALAEHPGLPVVFAGGVMSSDLIRTYVTNRVPNAHFVPGNFQ